MFLWDEEILKAFEQERLSEKILEDGKTQGRKNKQAITVVQRR